MGSYFAEKWEYLAAFPATFAQNPIFFIIAFAIGLPLIWLKWRVTGNSVSKAMQNQTLGLRTDADKKQVRHETGIGTRDILVMRPAIPGMAILFGLLFFGGGALFYALVVLQGADVTSKDWLTFAISVTFTVCAMIIIEMGQTRILVDETSIQKRRVLHRRQTVLFSEISSVEPRAKQISRGMVIQSKDREKMNVHAGFTGYRQLLERLAPHNAQANLFVKLLKAQPHARTS